MFKDVWNSLKKQGWFKFVFVGAVIFFAIKLFNTLKLGAKKLGTTFNNAQDATTLIQGSGGTLSNAQAMQRIEELKQIAKDCSTAFWDFRFPLGSWIVLYRVDEDEEMAIYALNRLNNAVEAALVSDYYKAYNSEFDTSTWFSAAKGMSLKADVNKYLSSGELNQIKTVVRSNLR